MAIHGLKFGWSSQTHLDPCMADPVCEKAICLSISPAAMIGVYSDSGGNSLLKHAGEKVCAPFQKT